jgi:hypothetical protein
MIGKLSFFVGCSVAAWVFFRVLPEMRAHRAVMSEMPPDIAAGDANVPEPGVSTLVVEEVVSLHAPEDPRERSA